MFANPEHYDYLLLVSSLVNLPPLDQFIFGNKAHEEYLKWEMVIWALSLANISPEDISQLPDRLLVTAIALVFMVQQEQISANEADILLLAEYDVAKCVFHPPDIKEPKILDGRAVRVAQQYNKITTLIEDCLFVCGLESRIVSYCPWCCIFIISEALSAICRETVACCMFHTVEYCQMWPSIRLLMKYATEHKFCGQTDICRLANQCMIIFLCRRNSHSMGSIFMH